MISQVVSFNVKNQPQILHAGISTAGNIQPLKWAKFPSSSLKFMMWKAWERDMVREGRWIEVLKKMMHHHTSTLFFISGGRGRVGVSMRVTSKVLHAFKCLCRCVEVWGDGFACACKMLTPHLSWVCVCVCLEGGGDSSLLIPATSESQFPLFSSFPSFPLFPSISLHVRVPSLWFLSFFPSCPSASPFLHNAPKAFIFLSCAFRVLQETFFFPSWKHRKLLAGRNCKAYKR